MRAFPAVFPFASATAAAPAPVAQAHPLAGQLTLRSTGAGEGAMRRT
ncbi:MAG TPA: hypothetical protein VFX50_14395 [Gemmatimonadales bacterium]|nr:hypothetical protein [Gemmatimonadales bacterium]